MTDTNLLNRTLRQFRRVLRLSKSDSKANLARDISKDLPEEERPLIRRHMDACLEGRGGEVSARARAAELGELYLTLSDTGRQHFLEVLALDYDVPTDRVAPLIGAWQAASDPDERKKVQDELRQMLTPPRMNLLHQFNELDAGVKFLVDMRADLLAMRSDSPALKALSSDLRELLASWFDVGFLDLERITWATPASVLEKLIEYEAVHAIKSWDDLKNRLGEDRRCYAFFHPRMPDEPLIFVQIALVQGLSDNVQGLLDQSAPVVDTRDANTAIFYSISNCQTGLAGVSFGNFLIKRVASAIARDLPSIKTFSTLSPIPGLSRWITKSLGEPETSFGTGEVPPVLMDAFGAEDWNGVLTAALGRSDWVTDEGISSALRPALQKAGARYLLEAKRGTQALDRVAHFHLTNGAQVARLNWLGDTSDHGMTQSVGMMVNYLYELDQVDANHERYSTNGEVSAANTVARLVR
jgi:malonyl-CoA decarboxylase